MRHVEWLMLGVTNNDAGGGYGTASLITYHKTSVAMAMDLVGNVDWAASVFSNLCVALLLWIERPYGVVVLGVCEQLFCCEWGHGQVSLLRQASGGYIHAVRRSATALDAEVMDIDFAPTSCTRGPA